MRHCSAISSSFEPCNLINAIIFSVKLVSTFKQVIDKQAEKFIYKILLCIWMARVVGFQASSKRL